MRIFIDTRTTRNKYQGHGVGVYTENMAEWLPKVSPQVSVVRSGWKNCDVFLQPSFYDGFPHGFKGLKVIMVHDLTLLKFNYFSARGCLVNALRGLEYRYKLRSVKKADLVLTNSENTRQDVLHYLKIPSFKVKVIHLGLKNLPSSSLPFDQLGIPNEPFILYIGGVEFNKNIERLIKAFDQLKKQNLPEDLIDLKLVLGGRGFWQKSRPETIKIMNLIDSSKINNDIILPGFIPDEDLRSWYQATLAFVYPSFYEGFGLPILESMACGCPVICSRAGSIPEVGGDAVCYSDLSASAFLGNMRRILSDPVLCDEMRAKGIDQASRFSWRRCAEETTAVYESVLK